MIEQHKIIITGGSGFIGTNLIDLFENEKYDFINLDKAPPTKESHKKYWISINLLNYNKLKEIIKDIRPTVIIHLAARTDTFGSKIEDYVDNTKGTENLVKAVIECNSVNHIIITSTQYVYKSNTSPFPSYDTAYLPYTVYGESKRITEEIVRNSKLNCGWTITRPTNIWGPWHMRYPRELWKIINMGLYFHPAKQSIVKSYGYVKNVVHQINQIINAPAEDVFGKTYYLGDLPIDSYLWVNEFSLRLKRKSIKKIPLSLLRMLSLCGDLLRNINIKFPIYSARYNNLIESYPTPTSYCIDKFGLSNPSLTNNVDDTVLWLENEGRVFFKYWENKFAFK